MKVALFEQAEDVLQVVTFEPGDEPEGMRLVNVPPVLVNRYQRARIDLDAVCAEITEHLSTTEQEW